MFISKLNTIGYYCLSKEVVDKSLENFLREYYYLDFDEYLKF